MLAIKLKKIEALKNVRIRFFQKAFGQKENKIEHSMPSFLSLSRAHAQTPKHLPFSMYSFHA